jgi:hypothetical protein
LHQAVAQVFGRNGQGVIDGIDKRYRETQEGQMRAKRNCRACRAEFLMPLAAKDPSKIELCRDCWKKEKDANAKQCACGRSFSAKDPRHTKCFECFVKDKGGKKPVDIVRDVLKVDTSNCVVCNTHFLGKATHCSNCEGKALCKLCARIVLPYVGSNVQPDICGVCSVMSPQRPTKDSAEGEKKARRRRTKRVTEPTLGCLVCGPSDCTCRPKEDGPP